MRHADEREVVIRAQPDERTGQIGTRVLVEPGERLVEHERGRSRRDRRREHDAAGLPAAELVDTTRPDRRGVEADLGERLPRDVRRRARRRGDLARNRRSQQLQAGVLERHADPADRLPQRLPFEAGVALAGNQQSAEDPRERRLARAVVPDDEHRLAAVDAQVEAGERALRPRRAASVHVADAPQQDERLGVAAGPIEVRDRHGIGGLGPLDDPSVVERDDAVGDGALGPVVRDVHDRRSLLRGQRTQQREKLRAALLVDHRGRLVGDEQPGPPGERGGDGEPLQLPARQRRRLAVRERAETHATEQRVDVDRHRSGKAPRHVVSHAHTEHLQLRALEHDGGAARGTQPGRAGAAHAPCGRRPPREDAGQRRLARAVRADDGDELAGLDVDRHVVQRVAVGARVPVADRTQPRGNRCGRPVIRRRIGVERGAVGREGGVHPAQRGRGDPVRHQRPEEDRDEQHERHRQPPVAHEKVDEIVEEVGHPAEAHPGQRAAYAAGRVADLVERELAALREREEEQVGDQRDHGPQDRECETDRAPDPVAATHREADDAAERGAAQHRRDDGHAEDEESDAGRRERARQQGPQAVARGQHRHRDDRDEKQHRADRRRDQVAHDRSDQ